MRTLARFTTTEARNTPAALRYPHNRGAWLALSEEARRAHIMRILTEQITAEEADKLAARQQAEAEAKKAPGPTPEEAPAPSPEYAPAPAPSRAHTSRYVVACIGGCGEFIPATSTKPVLVRCERNGNRQTKAIQTPRAEISTHDLMLRLKRELAEATAKAKAAETTRTRRNPSKPKKKRRRAVCSKASSRHV